MPLAEHRQCARHIYEGFKKQFGGVEFRLLFWAASKATYPQLFQKIMEKIKRANPKAHDYLMKKDLKTWSRAYFNEGMCCEAVENGFSECFNSVLVSVRHKLIITMLESMRVIIMERMNTMRHLMKKWNGEICPNIQKNPGTEKGSTKKKGHNKSTCKKDPIPVVPKEKGNPGRPKKQQNMETVPEDNEIPTFVHNPRDEMGASNSRGVFYDRRVNNKKRGASCSNANQNRRGGKTKGGRVFPTQRLGRMAAWFGIDPANSNKIENTQAANAPLPTNNTQAGNIPGTQQSQVLPTTQESTRTERPITRRVVAEQMLQTRSEGAAQR
ncbi:hypothetical protein Tco_0736962 [Tanacetum coccineum]